MTIILQANLSGGSCAQPLFVKTVHVLLHRLRSEDVIAICFGAV